MAIGPDNSLVTLAHVFRIEDMARTGERLVFIAVAVGLPLDRVRKIIEGLHMKVIE